MQMRRNLIHCIIQWQNNLALSSQICHLVAVPNLERSFNMTNRELKNALSRFLCVYLRTYPRRTPLSCGSGGGCHWTIIDWFVRPLATIFFGGALGASSRSINLTGMHEKKKKKKRERQMIMLYFIRCPVIRASV